MCWGAEVLREGLPPPTCHIPCVTCHVTCVTCHVTCVTCQVSHIFHFFKVVKLDSGGSVINGATQPSFP